MKSVFLVCIIFYHLSASAQIAKERHLSIVRNIETDVSPQNYVEVSEDALPTTLYRQLMEQISLFQFTLLAEAEVQVLFDDLTKDALARMKNPKGYCAQRRYYIQNLLKKMNIVSGQIFIKCPKNDGSLRLKDQVSGSYYSFSNYHDANIVAVSTNQGIQFQILDLQFEDLPVSLEDYLAEVESSQKIRPAKTRGTETGRGTCYWSISTDHLTF